MRELNKLMVPIYPLDMFRWRPTQKRLVIDNAQYMAEYLRIMIRGVYHTIIFEFHGDNPDIFTKTRKMSAVYVPSNDLNNPPDKADIKLYIHL